MFGGSAPFAVRLLAGAPWLEHAPVAHAGALRKRARRCAIAAAHPAVERVHYPGLVDHPGHEIAVRQMSGWGGMLSFQVRGGVKPPWRSQHAWTVHARHKSGWSAQPD